MLISNIYYSVIILHNANYLLKKSILFLQVRSFEYSSFSSLQTITHNFESYFRRMYLQNTKQSTRVGRL